MKSKCTPLHAQHLKLGAKMVDFGGWDMPVQYHSILQEHAAVRERAGLFDVSHMGVFEVHGHQALAALETLFPNDISRLVDGRGLYTQLCNPQGGMLDDLLVFRLEAERFWLIVNASNRDSDLRWIKEQIQHFDAKVKSLADEIGILALQGPLAGLVLSEIVLQPTDRSALPNFGIRTIELAGCEFQISRSGYTGEDGFELYVPHHAICEVWEILLKQGQTHGLEPVGLGARDTLRLEAGMPLYGHELNDQITPLEAGLGWSVKLNKESDFIGRQALEQQQAEGLTKKRIGIALPESKRAPREGYTLYQGEQTVGQVTSGSLSPTLGYPIGMAYVDLPIFDPDLNTEVDIRGQRFKIELVKLPFYRRNQ